MALELTLEQPGEAVIPDRALEVRRSAPCPAEGRPKRLASSNASLVRSSSPSRTAEISSSPTRSANTACGTSSVSAAPVKLLRPPDSRGTHAGPYRFPERRWAARVRSRCFRPVARCVRSSPLRAHPGPRTSGGGDLARAEDDHPRLQGARRKTRSPVASRRTRSRACVQRSRGDPPSSSSPRSLSVSIAGSATRVTRATSA